jgi:hypothetical protein
MKSVKIDKEMKNKDKKGTFAGNWGTFALAFQL